MKDVLHTLSERGLLNAVINAEGLSLLPQGVPVYAGFDATAASLHVGHLVVMRTLHVLSDHGAPVIGLVGEGTAQVGDPSFRTSERKMLGADAVAHNAQGIANDIQSLLPDGAQMVSNGEWLHGLGALELLTETGKHFTLARMLSFESVSNRVGDGLTFLEFAYMLLQARDFLELRDRFGCRMQVGGSDQWANIICGTDLIRKSRAEDAFGITAPLLTRSDGRKMGKSGGNAVWLNAEMTPDFDFWQFWRNTPDADVGKFLRIFTDMPKEECDRLGALGGSEINIGKIALANAVTGWVRSPERAAACETASLAVSGDDADLSAIPRVSVTANSALFRILVESGIADSAKAAKRTIHGGVKVNDVRVEDPLHVPADGDLIKVGKKRLLVVMS